ncbi:uncharacterized protein F5Z01DRAFT_228025 [Emericellopsis atlantica]|uniref:Zn(2)-C6 fungal-type domain-containing protein n=1 Tax=Emericellopsis atlantica TaxID=2614577 RepID=A0A9P8CM79_9HYPO|nr:uncharacterized protein F5Z01DRAFT_228025 [Emericellopsis atlantica]KAG9252434.1 hypothetical protein F5Z01DRAFT_228025 [Emericellopsis atlantica]
MTSTKRPHVVLEDMAANSAPFRSTQRAPRSCIPCSTRKVKCDKSEPCLTCVRRGESASCIRETVLIRGEPKKWQESTGNPPQVEDLRRENEQLRDELRKPKSGQLSHSTPSTPRGPRNSHSLENSDSIEDALWDSIRFKAVPSGSTIGSWEEAVLPSRSASDHLIAYDRTWNCWVHYAVEYPQFQQECDAFMDALESGQALESYDHHWKAVYFSVLCAALLMMEEEEATCLVASEHVDMDVSSLCRNWYDAAIFSLHRADFMRVPHIGTVQCIAVLGMCFNNLGDAELCRHMWNIALRIAQKLGLNTPRSEHAGSLGTEAQHRLWWTLTICEWLGVPHEPTSLEEVDFEVPLPRPHVTTRNGGKTVVDPAHYHVFMARTSIVYNRFCQSLQRSPLSSENVVRAADEELALVIDTLPDHLQPELEAHGRIREPELSEPWIKWQRFDITLVLLHHRIRINRTLQRHWLSSPGEFAWARTVCVQSALDIIWISRNWDQPVSMRKQWALSFHLFVAAILLLREWQSSLDGRSLEYKEAIEAGLSILEQVQSHNAIARHAVRILKENMYVTF